MMQGVAMLHPCPRSSTAGPALMHGRGVATIRARACTVEAAGVMQAVAP